LPTSEPSQPDLAELDSGRDPDYFKGLAFILGASLFNSSVGYLIRIVEQADGWQILFYRSLAFLVFMIGLLAWKHGPKKLPERFKETGRAGIIAGCLLGVSFSGFIFALLNTTVANVVFIGASSPFLAALMAFVFLKERLAWRTWIAMAVALGGVGVMVGDGLSGGGLLGIGLAILTISTFAGALVAIRSGKKKDMRPATCLAGVIALCTALVMSDSLVISLHDFLVISTLGVVQLGLQYVFLTAGTRHVPAGEVALMGRLNLVLSPFWAWLAVGELPSSMSLLGGGIIVAALLFYGISALRGTTLRV
jgi:drug/metabolite transporter (DMT)-like permease